MWDGENVNKYQLVFAGRDTAGKILLLNFSELLVSNSLGVSLWVYKTHKKEEAHPLSSWETHGAEACFFYRFLTNMQQ